MCVQEKAEQDAIKRRELAEFLATQAKKGIVNPNTVLDKPPTHPGNNNANNNNNGKRPPRFRADSADGAELDDHGGYNNNNNYNNGRGRSSTYSDSEEDYSRNSRAPAKLSLPPGAGGGRGGGRVGGGGAGGSWDDQDDERDGRGGRSQAYPNRGGGAGGGRGGGGRGGGGHNEDDSDRDYPSDGSNDGRHGGGRGGVRGGGRGGGGGARGNAGGRNTADSAGAEDDDYVPKEEYDELSKLCDKLLTQQEQLQLEVRKQADMLKVSGFNFIFTHIMMWVGCDTFLLQIFPHIQYCERNQCFCEFVRLFYNSFLSSYYFCKLCTGAERPSWQWQQCSQRIAPQRKCQRHQATRQGCSRAGPALIPLKAHQQIQVSRFVQGPQRRRPR